MAKETFYIGDKTTEWFQDKLNDLSANGNEITGILKLKAKSLAFHDTYNAPKGFVDVYYEKTMEPKNYLVVKREEAFDYITKNDNSVEVYYKGFPRIRKQTTINFDHVDETYFLLEVSSLT